MTFGLGANRARSLLAVLGVAVSAAMLLDMVMLATGMRESFRQLLVQRVFEIRLSPRGTLPFDTDATIGDAAAMLARVRAVPAVAAVSPVLGGQLRFVRDDTTIVTAAALGTPSEMQGEYEMVEGHAPAANEVVVSDPLLSALGLRLGDTVRAAAGYDPQLRAFVGGRVVTIAGRARFLYTAAGERVTALPLETLQAMTSESGGGSDRVSLVLVRLREGADVEATRAAIERLAPNVTALSIEDAMRQIDQRLSYFRQLAFILGTISLMVGFLLVTTIVTVTVNERVGEIAVLRAIGVTRARIVLRIGADGLVLTAAGSVLGLGLGLVTGRYLNGILAAFPGLPEAVDFFFFQPRSAWSALGMLLVAGMLAGVYPSWRAASLPIASTLRDEAVG